MIKRLLLAILNVLRRPVVYPEGQCHPRAYKEVDDAWIEAHSNAEAQANVEAWRRADPRFIYDFNNAAGRVVYRRVPKRRWER